MASSLTMNDQERAAANITPARERASLTLTQLAVLTGVSAAPGRTAQGNAPAAMLPRIARALGDVDPQDLLSSDLASNTPNAAAGLQPHAAVERGNSTYARVMRSGWPRRRPDIVVAVSGLQDALEAYEAIRTEPVHLESVYRGLEGNDDAYGQALERTAQAVAEWDAELGGLVPSVITEPPARPPGMSAHQPVPQAGAIRPGRP